MKKITTPISFEQIKGLRSGDEVLFSGVIYTARDQAHKRLVQALKSARRLPVDLAGAVIYYCGPTGTPRGKIIGSCGPTTSSRMDAFTPELLKAGLKGMIGKGRRSPEVKAAIRRNKGVYFLAYSGCGALIAQYVLKASLVAYKDLGPEAIYKLEVKDLPLIVAIDAKGRDLYAEN